MIVELETDSGLPHHYPSMTIEGDPSLRGIICMCQQSYLLLGPLMCFDKRSSAHQTGRKLKAAKLTMLRETLAVEMAFMCQCWSGLPEMASRRGNSPHLWERYCINIEVDMDPSRETVSTFPFLLCNRILSYLDYNLFDHLYISYNVSRRRANAALLFSIPRP